MSFLDMIKSPPKQYSPYAFWFWYGSLTPEALREQIRMMADKGVYNGFMHARAYLETEYLGKEWWQAIEACIDEGEKTGFYPWLYDEYAWPSGTAGSTFRHGVQKWSRTLSGGEKNMAKYLETQTYATSIEAKRGIEQNGDEENVVAIFCKSGGKWHYTENIGKASGETMVFYRRVNPRFVDYLNYDTISEFIEYTHEEYKKRFSAHFGKRVPGIFFDEIFMISKTPWTDSFAEEFKRRKGYDIIPVLYAINDSEQEEIRNDYYNVISELYEESFFSQISAWCKENNLLLTGHIEEFFIAHPGRQGQFFNNMRHLDIPGADCHDYRYRFPRKITYREPKFAVGTARAYGKERIMSEAFGGAGWGCPLSQFKRGVNTLCAMGINLITLHGFYSQCSNQGMQGDWPTSFFYQNPYWRYFKDFSDYISRVCYMNTVGKPVVDVGLYYPIEQMQRETVSGVPNERAFALDKAWNDAMNTLIENQIDVDIIDEPCILGANVSDGVLSVGSQSFKVLLLPFAAKISEPLERKLSEFEAAGGAVLYYSASESIKDGTVVPADLPTALGCVLEPDIAVLEGEKNDLYVNHRVIEDKQVYFVANGLSEKRNVTFSLREVGGVYAVSAESGDVRSVTSRVVGTRCEVELELCEDEGIWLVVDKQRANEIVRKERCTEEIQLAGVWNFMTVSDKLCAKEQLRQTGNLLEIPLAMFSSCLCPDAKQIRIQNTPAEKGKVSRHLSLWNGSWITRRPDWIDNAQKKQLFFRRKFRLDTEPISARLCIAAVNRWTLFVNGNKVAFCDKARESTVVDICKYLVKGENLVAAKVENDTPMEHFNLLSTDKLPKEEMISLLVEGEINAGEKMLTILSDEKWQVNDKEQEGWERLDFENAVYKARSVDALITCGESDNWFYAWERGRPPMLPWGDLALFGKTLTYPQRVCYTVTLPAGTGRIFYPEVSGSDISVTVDGMERIWNDGVCTVFNDGKPHTMQIHVSAQNENDGLLSNVKVETLPFESTLCDWRMHGLLWYSGFARYENRFNINKQNGRYVLKFENVCHHVEVWINGKCVCHRLWQPYEIDVTDFVNNGENEIAVIVSNSAAVERQFMLVDEGEALGWNRYWNYDNIQREGENLMSGILGKVRLDVISKV